MKLALLAFCILSFGCTSPRHKSAPTDHFDGYRFFNSQGIPPKSLWEVLKWQITEEKAEWPKFIDDVNPEPLPREINDSRVALTFINHATVYLQTKRLSVITDPIWSQRSSPVSWAGPQRVRRPSHSVDELPTVDIVLISHNHYDHFDIASLKALNEKHKPIFLVPIGDGRLLEEIGISNFKEMDWNETYLHEPSQSEIHFLRCNHWSARGLFDRNLSLWGAFLIRTKQHKIYFGGDSGYGTHYKEVYEKWGPMDISLIPIGAYEPRWFMKDQHLNPEDAVMAHQDLKSKRSFGIHFGTFQLTNEGVYEPVEQLAKEQKAKAISDESFLAPQFGKVYWLD